MNYNEQELERRKSLNEIMDIGLNPYPSESFEINIDSKNIKENYLAKKNDKKFKNVVLAGRLMSRRIMGSASFAEIMDSSGKIQLYVRRDDICDGEDKSLYNDIFKKKLDLGDIIGISGFVFETKLGEITVHVQSLKLLSKSLKPIPVVKEATDDKGNKSIYDAFTDKETKYRKRYLDLIINKSSQETFIKRSKIINSMRGFFNEKDYLEVETPILQPIYGGAAARPFKTYHNTLDMPLYLRIANELYLKRLIIGGFKGVYEFGKDFRNEGMSRFHNPEFTQCELYVAYKDYIWMMNFLEDLFVKVCLDLNGNTNIKCGENEINFKKPWKKYTMYEVIKKFTGIDVTNMGKKELLKLCKDLKIKTDNSMGRGKLIDEIFGEKCEKNLIQPTFITDYPIEMSPLAKKHRSKEGVVERFELICNGKELCNAFSELNDPIDQKERFNQQIELGKQGDEEAMVLDEDYIEALEYGLPPTAGIGIGIDRLTMILTNSESIQDVIFFPQMKPKKK